MAGENDRPTRRDVLKRTGLATGTVLGTGVAASGSVGASHGGDSSCGPETGLQGRVPIEDQVSGRSAHGYCDGVSLVGKNTIEDRGANFQLTWYGDYAYVGMAHMTTRDDPVTDDPLWGTAVIDASDPTDPRLTTVVKSPANFNAWEGMWVSEKRDLLVVCGRTQYFDVLDLSDPAHPTLLSSISLPMTAHGLVLSPDGKTAYVSSGDDDPGMMAFDITDPSKPALLATHPFAPHDVNVDRTGTRLYAASSGVVAFDISSIERRESEPSFDRLGEQRTADSTHAGPVFRRQGRRYFVTQDEMDGDGKAGESGGCPWGYVRIVDVTDGTTPHQVGDFKLEVNELSNCHLTQEDATLSPGMISAQAFYSSHYGGLDRNQDPNAAFFTWYASGLRVVDVRDERAPNEFAYYNPPPNPGQKFGAYSIFSEVHEYVDASTSYVRYRPESGHIWFVSDSNGFQIVELTGDAADVPK